MLPTKCVLGVIDMVLGDLETVGRNWTLKSFSTEMGHKGNCAVSHKSTAS